MGILVDGDELLVAEDGKGFVRDVAEVRPIRRWDLKRHQAVK